jgi:acyl-CoA reductase-like NAD-dependent aldehyde dehydrogenase
MHDLLRNHIDGEWRDASTQKTLDNTNPADTRQVLGQVVRSGPEDVQAAVAAAKRAFEGWRKLPAPKRGAIVAEATRIMATRKEELSRALTLEEGKNLNESRGEVQKSINVMEFMVGESRRLKGQTIPSEMPKTFAYTVRSPLGVVGLITPWNFPVCIPVWKIAPALVAGNTIVFKPSEITPWTANLVVECFLQAGLPKGVLNVVHGLGEEIGAALVEHPEVAAISFTGSNAVGTHVYTTAAKQLKKVQCEMGGKNPVIVLEDADLDLAAIAIAQGAFGSTGQRCTATSRVIVAESVADALVEKIVALAQKVVPGNGLENPAAMGPSINEEQLSKVLSYHQVAEAEGAVRRCGGAERLTGGGLEHGYFTAATVYDHVKGSSRLATEEIFGPVLSVIRVKDWKEAIAVSNGVPYGLSSSLYTQDVTRAMEYVDEVETGMLHLNSPTVGGEAQLPFGGVKATGVGQREMGETAIDFFTEWKTVYIDYTGQKREGNLY